MFCRTFTIVPSKSERSLEICPGEMADCACSDAVAADHSPIEHSCHSWPLITVLVHCIPNKQATNVTNADDQTTQESQTTVELDLVMTRRAGRNADEAAGIINFITENI